MGSLKPPGTFGELALLDPTAKRSATVVCTAGKGAWVVKLDRAAFERSATHPPGPAALVTPL